LQNFRRYLREYENSNDTSQLIRLQSSFNTAIDYFKESEKETLLFPSTQLFVTFKTLLIHGSIELLQKVNLAIGNILEDNHKFNEDLFRIFIKT
jgi:hypothetical protein